MPSGVHAPLPIAIVAALARELRPFRSRTRPDRCLVRTGVGGRNVRRQFRAFLSRHTVRAVIHVGVAGALRPELRRGDLVVATRICGSPACLPAPEWLARARRAEAGDIAVHYAPVVTIAEIAWTSEAKRALARRWQAEEPGFVDMESAAVAALCAERGIPFAVVRCISDTLEEDLPLNFNRCRTAGGSVGPLRVLAASRLRPAVLGELHALGQRCTHCAQQLARFVERMIGPESET